MVKSHILKPKSLTIINQKPFYHRWTLSRWDENYLHNEYFIYYMATAVWGHFGQKNDFGENILGGMKVEARPESFRISNSQRRRVSYKANDVTA